MTRLVDVQIIPRLQWFVFQDSIDAIRIAQKSMVPPVACRVGSRSRKQRALSRLSDFRMFLHVAVSSSLPEFSAHYCGGESRSRNCSAIQSMNARSRGDKCRVCE